MRDICFEAAPFQLSFVMTPANVEGGRWWRRRRYGGGLELSCAADERFNGNQEGLWSVDKKAGGRETASAVPGANGRIRLTKICCRDFKPDYERASPPPPPLPLLSRDIKSARGVREDERGAAANAVERLT